jgi:hypothetical protein
MPNSSSRDSVGQVLGRHGYAQNSVRLPSGASIFDYAQGEGQVIVVTPIELPSPNRPLVEPNNGARSPASLAEIFFRQLQSDIERILTWRPVKDILLQGDGSMPIPEWFRKWCGGKFYGIFETTAYEDPDRLDELVKGFAERAKANVEEIQRGSMESEINVDI